MQRLSCRFALLPICLLAVLVPGNAFAFSGMLSSATGGLLGGGNWLQSGMSIEWSVLQNPDQTWHYSYTFTHDRGETSHLILEVSSNFTADDIFNATGDFGATEIRLFGQEPGNPLIPGSLFGVKFDGASGLVTHIDFDSRRMPTWGDFYSKDGAAGGLGENVAWNAGFTEMDVDPTAPADNGSLDNHLLVPDTATEPIPEPSGLLLMGSGLVAAAGMIRRRRR